MITKQQTSLWHDWFYHIKSFLHAIKFSHSIFSLSFALMAFIHSPPLHFLWWDLFFIIVAVLTARTWAMGVNRLVDENYDAKNPRTQDRALVTKAISVPVMLCLTSIAGLFFILTSLYFGWLPFFCSFIILLILAFYSYTKRYTWGCHLWLGLCLGLAPLGVDVVMQRQITLPTVILAFGVACWVAGFDILYSLQDRLFDTAQGLHSIPVHFGQRGAQLFAALLHVLATIFFTTYGQQISHSWTYFIACTLSGILLLLLHANSFIKDSPYLLWTSRQIFKLNGFIALLLLAGCFLDTLI